MSKSSYSQKFGLLLGGALLLALSFLFYCTREKENSFVRVPTKYFPESNILCFKAQMKGNQHLLQIDSGAQMAVSLTENKFREYAADRKRDQTECFDINHNCYLSETFISDVIDVGPLQLADMEVKSDSLEFLNSGCKLDPTEEKTQQEILEYSEVDGRLGSYVLGKVDYWLFDFPNHAVYVLFDFKQAVDELGFSISDFISIPLETSSFITIALEVDSKIKKFAIDTGANVSVLHSSTPDSKYKNGEISYRGQSLGAAKFFLFNLTEDLHSEFTGILGMDFLMHHVVIFDFKNNRIYINYSERTGQAGDSSLPR